MRFNFVTKISDTESIKIPDEIKEKLKENDEVEILIQPVKDVYQIEGIPYGHQSVDSLDIQSVIDVLESDLITQGPKTVEFEKRLCEYTGAKYAIVCSNGTAALHLAVKALDLAPGFEGITTPNTFVASSNCMIYNNGKPVFADIQEDSHNIDPDKIKKKITDKTKLIIPVDFAGHPCDMEEIQKIAKENDLFVIRDACHSIGSHYKGEKTGNCKYSDMTIFSFHPVKHMTTGEGGAILTNNKAFYERLKLLRTHGITRDPDLMAKNDGPWYYEMVDLGYNYRITDFQSALGISQLGKLDQFVKKRLQIVKQYNEAFKDLEFIKSPKEREYTDPSYHLYVVDIDFKKINMSRADLIRKLEKEKQIGVQVHYIPVHLQPYYRKNFGYKEGDYPVCEEYYRSALSLPLYPKMSMENIERVIQAVQELKK
ncbi:MAG: UDP-4-amino-4,6-dideoxy-N-acetyl-beta-L-altrosamine transaminase [Spirochaetes bacterium]|nr:UDP-4-amino-4,6-dideoxy-N-acetyl-beta-L-altrosamine transaminase [Spirochaetota bacterium]